MEDHHRQSIGIRALGNFRFVTFSALVGTMSPARAVSDESLAREILKTVAELLKNSASGHRH
jgi:TetR/AcrR family transcriptional regulator, transcriptional repressor for nem operon